MATFPITSRYAKSNIVLDDRLLRDRLTQYLTDPEPISFVDRDDNIRLIVRLGDRLENIATAVYADPRLWWVIAAFQPLPIQNPLVLEPGRELIVPSFSYVFTNILKQSI